MDVKVVLFMEKPKYQIPDSEFLEVQFYSIIAQSGSIEDLSTGEEIPWV